MPASSSSPIISVIDQLLTAGTSLGDGLPSVLTALNVLADTRKRRGVRHKLGAVLGLAACAVLAGARSFVAIADWAADADHATLAQFGVWDAVPCESTFRRVLQGLDAQALDDHLGEWAQARTAAATGRRIVAVDGKTLRGSGRRDGPGRHLLAAFGRPSLWRRPGAGQRRSENERDTDALHAAGHDRVGRSSRDRRRFASQRGHAEYLHGRGAHSVLTVKGNQPKLHTQLTALPWRDVPVANVTRGQGHGRREIRRLKVTEVRPGSPFPHAVQAIQLRRRRRTLTGKWSTETVYAITSLTGREASPQQLAEIVRGHWAHTSRLFLREPGRNFFAKSRSNRRTAISFRSVPVRRVRSRKAPNRKPCRIHVPASPIYPTSSRGCRYFSRRPRSTGRNR